jgi:hypothetical protein
MIISNYQDPFGDKEPLVHDDLQRLNHDRATASFDTTTRKQLPYVDEEPNHFSSAHDRPEESSLVYNAADIGRSDNYHDLGSA